MNDGIVIDEPNPLFAHREERREHCESRTTWQSLPKLPEKNSVSQSQFPVSTALQFFDFLTDSEELGTVQYNERTQSLTTSIRRRIEQLAREIREELDKDGMLLSTHSHMGHSQKPPLLHFPNLIEYAKKNKVRRIEESFREQKLS